MASYKDIIPKINDALGPIVELGTTLILAFVVIDVLFPGTTGVVNNIGVIVSQFSSEGLAGLIALLLFLMVFQRK
jgi:hypothetical protein